MVVGFNLITKVKEATDNRSRTNSVEPIHFLKDSLYTNRNPITIVVIPLLTANSQSWWKIINIAQKITPHHNQNNYDPGNHTNHL